LSGGLDSSSIVCTAHLLNQEKVISNNGLEAFSVIYEGFPCDERFFINEVIKKWNVNSNYFIYDKYVSWLDFEEALKYSDIVYSPLLLIYAPAL